MNISRAAPGSVCDSGRPDASAKLGEKTVNVELTRFENARCLLVPGSQSKSFLSLPLPLGEGRGEGLRRPYCFSLSHLHPHPARSQREREKRQLALFTITTPLIPNASD